MYVFDHRPVSSGCRKSGVLLGNEMLVDILLLGIAGVVAALLVREVMWSSLLGVFAFSSFWTIKEVFEQEERVRKGWFPKNPKRKYNF